MTDSIMSWRDKDLFVKFYIVLAFFNAMLFTGMAIMALSTNEPAIATLFTGFAALSLGCLSMATLMNGRKVETVRVFIVPAVLMAAGFTLGIAGQAAM